MNVTSNQLLGNILSTLTKIEAKVGSTNSQSSVISGGATTGGSNYFTNQYSSKNNSKLSPLSLLTSVTFLPVLKKLTKGLNKNQDVKFYLNFIKDIVDINTIADKIKNKNSVQELLASMFGEKKDIIKNIKNFANLEKKGTLNNVVKGYSSLIKGIVSIADSISESSIKKLSDMSNYITKPLLDISSALMGFTASLLTMGVGFLVANSLLGFGNTVGLFASTLLGISATLMIFAGSIALIGKMDDGVQSGISVLNGISMSILGVVASLILSAVSILALNAITGNPFVTAGAFIGGFLMVASGLLLMVGTMALIGTFSSIINKGQNSLNGMALSILAMSLTLALAGGLIFGASHLEMGEHTNTLVAIGIGIIGFGVAFAALGSMGSVISKGSSVLFLMSVGVLSFSVALWASVELMDKAFGKEGGWMNAGILIGSIVTMASVYALGAVVAPAIAVTAGALLLMSASIYATSISIKKSMDVVGNVSPEYGKSLEIAIGGFIGGIWGGVQKGLGINTKGNILDTLISGGKAIGKMAVLTAASGLLIALSAGVIMFVKALSFFGSNGNIQLYETNSNGEIVGGKTVNTVAAAQSIGTALSVFLSEISNATEKMDFAKVQQVSEALLGSSSASFLGLKIKPKPGLIDATLKFTEMLDKFAGKKNTFRIYNPETKRYDEVKIQDISKSIAESITIFYNTIINGIKEISTPEKYKEVENMAIVLMGQKAQGFLPWLKGTPDKVGILEPVMVFADVVEKFNKDLNLDGGKIADKIISFSKTLMDGLKDSGITDDTQTEGFNNFTKMIDNLSVQADKIDKVAEAISKMADATERLLRASNDLDLSKISSINENSKNPNPYNNNESHSQNYTSSPYNTQQSGNYGNTDYISDAVATKVMSMFSQKTFNFHFTEAYKGILKI